VSTTPPLVNTPDIQYLRLPTPFQPNPSESEETPEIQVQDIVATPIPEDLFTRQACSDSRLRPHQYHVLPAARLTIEQWRPVAESGNRDPLSRIPSLEHLIYAPTTESFVVAFRSRITHSFAVKPTSLDLVNRYQLGYIYICSSVGIHPPDSDFPLGRLTYSFVPSFVDRFRLLPPLYRIAYEGAFCLVQAEDLLDGRVVVTYGSTELAQDGHLVLADFHTVTVDNTRVHPSLLRFCLSPRVPLYAVETLGPHRLSTFNLGT